MASFGLKNPVWDLNKSKYDEITEYPLMATTGPVIMIVTCYLTFVLKIGPKIMRKREALKLTNVLLAYNFIQVVLSAYMVQMYFNVLLTTGFTPKTCYMNDDKTRKEIILGVWIYLVAKVSELFDTVFFVLRKKDKQITFLHLYHHTVMVIGTWAVLKYWPSQSLFYIGFINSLVHVFMYTYYGLAALGPNVAKYLKWKKYMTTFQLVQFISIVVQYYTSIQVSDCPPSKGVAMFMIGNTLFFFLLFSNFYKKSYKEQKLTEKPNGICTLNGKGPSCVQFVQSTEQKTEKAL